MVIDVVRFDDGLFACQYLWEKKNKIWIWTAVDHFKRGILDWVIGDHSAETFEPLWAEGIFSKSQGSLAAKT